ncbi:MAG: hypothetical protein HBSAPP02_29310 [Phycisphaerae bacterium]|nr:MAG: DUF2029 domain-containing protein [Planctomycetia bacterium]RIK68456.1 MAG: hypothetical protein DCC66_10390 [Planctomycetota bacterium]GJQ27899.1 MAG: hypothetical protein HBSAPP02_29310 [Phycisphaerae bacterium]
MSDTPHNTAAQLWRVRIPLILTAAAVYILTPRFTGEVFKTGGRFPPFAAAFLEGRLSVETATAPLDVLEELIPRPDGKRLFLAYPPLPAILMMPFVALLGVGAVTTQLACRVVSVVNVAVFDLCVVRAAKLLGRPPPTPIARAALGLFFAFGTATWHNAQFGGDWHYAHAVALAAMLAGTAEHCGRRRPTVVGACIAAALLTRPTAALCGVFFLMPWVRSRDYLSLSRALMPIGAGGLMLAVYNAARFGDPLDFGYSRMLLTGMGERLMAQYGQFHPHFIPRNAFWFFLAPPWIATEPVLRLTYDPRGLSLFLASPALIYAFVSLRAPHRQVGLRDAWFAMALCLLPLLSYFNSGFWQFGHRFALDYLPILLLLMMAGMSPRPSRTTYILMAMSVAMQTWGVLIAIPAPLPAWLAPAP